jgi:TolA-binding protein
MAENLMKIVEPSDAEMKRAELELKQLEIKAKKAELQDLEERLQERELKRDNKRQRSTTNGATLEQIKRGFEATQSRCNHKKGGNGADGIIGGQGDDSQFCVLKHVMPWGDTWIRCLRCGKTWKPPIKEQFMFDEKGKVIPNGKYNEAQYNKAVADYQTALQFQTRNVTSGSIQYRYSDGGDDARLKMADVNLR